MDHFANLHWIEAVGWLASILTVASYSVATMLPLRLLAIASSVCFAAYAFTLQLWPLLAMELILLPINIYRLWQVLALRGKLSRATVSTESDFSIIKAYGKRKTIKAGEVVFQRGDPVDQLYFIAKGRVSIEEMQVDLCAGDIFGEIAFFTNTATRIATARCTEDTQVYSIDEKHFMRLQFEDPSFGIAVMRIITHRLIENVGKTVEPAPGA
ncbi:cyclic nucleotide-binding protein [Roseobacter denitrificans]|uniref:Putative cyclic nucleotide-binding domain n=1 Tax=Roseobacter denitrificans (strain ATCC 33942 / OCh 114) TaxID=375451 RepID=Q16DI9_ROSDO|nr:cyclic nucleotide-binding domain-containing protein [Roseobacter denitrificans]ABG29954.1 putative cyclic nucleotide-binding domain [Roseobacter denitrificans OCh 114]AVL53165.1 cyclic nucleotide-binding protein [Roseobacter denitrificans]SFG38847.1 Cyclic nucleotide-binding domain-containing protein [Roseobacter denitrificans OCh 114]